MIEALKVLKRSQVIRISTIVFCIWGFLFGFIYFCVSPTASEVNEGHTNVLSIFSTVLGLLAGGCIAGFFSFEYKSADATERSIIIFLAYLLIAGIFIFIFLSLYCLSKVGLFKVIDPWVVILLFLGTYAVLNGIVLLERWDATMLK